MNNDEWRGYFRKLGVIIDGHFITTEGNRTNRYFTKEAALKDPEIRHTLVRHMIALTHDIPFGVVVGPLTGGLRLADAFIDELWCGGILPYQRKILAVFPEEREGKLIFRRGFADDICGKNVLILEDVFTTGRSAYRTLIAVEEAGGKVTGVVGICDRSGGRARKLFKTKIPENNFRPLYTMRARTWCPHKIPERLRAIPINKQFGHGDTVALDS